MKPEDVGNGRPLAYDQNAESADPELPGFLAPPPGSPVYHGFPILDDVVVDGFVFGMITDFESAPDVDGDAFVVAPDGNRAGLIWEVAPEAYVKPVVDVSETAGWGLWWVGFPASYPEPMSTREQARQNLAAILVRLKPEWERWTESRSIEPPQDQSS